MPLLLARKNNSKHKLLEQQQIRKIKNIITKQRTSRKPDKPINTLTNENRITKTTTNKID